MNEDKITVLAERGKEVLIKLEGCEVIKGYVYNTLRYEWWFDKEKMKQGIPGDDGGHIYCRGFAGVPEEEVIEAFNKSVFKE